MRFIAYVRLRHKACMETNLLWTTISDDGCLFQVLLISTVWKHGGENWIFRLNSHAENQFITSIIFIFISPTKSVFSSLFFCLSSSKFSTPHRGLISASFPTTLPASSSDNPSNSSQGCWMLFFLQCFQTTPLSDARGLLRPDRLPDWARARHTPRQGLGLGYQILKTRHFLTISSVTYSYANFSLLRPRGSRW